MAKCPRALVWWRAGKGNLFEKKQLGVTVENSTRFILEAKGIENGMAVRIFIPMDETQYIFMWKNPLFLYADSRMLKQSNGVEIINYREINTMVTTKADYSTPLFGNWYAGLFGLFMFDGNYIQGKVLLNPSGKINAIVVASRD